MRTMVTSPGTNAACSGRYASVASGRSWRADNARVRAFLAGRAGLRFLSWSGLRSLDSNSSPVRCASMKAIADVAGHGGCGATRVKPVVRALTAALATTAVLAMTGCGGDAESFVPSPGDPDKPARACLAVDEATPLAMGAADRRECERTMRGWYAETWYPRPDPADAYEGEAQLRYLRAKALECRRAADAYRLAGKDRWHALMRCLVIVRKR